MWVLNGTISWSTDFVGNLLSSAFSYDIATLCFIAFQCTAAGIPLLKKFYKSYPGNNIPERGQNWNAEDAGYVLSFLPHGLVAFLYAGYACGEDEISHRSRALAT